MLTRRQFSAVHQLTVLGPRIAVLLGPARGGKQYAARLFAHLLDAGLLTVDVPALLATPGGTAAEAVRRVIREAVLQPAVVYFTSADGFWADGDAALAGCRALESELAVAPVITLLGAASRCASSSCRRRMRPSGGKPGVARSSKPGPRPRRWPPTSPTWLWPSG
jgi:hypothetical protein